MKFKLNHPLKYVISGHYQKRQTSKKMELELLGILLRGNVLFELFRKSRVSLCDPTRIIRIIKRSKVILPNIFHKVLVIVFVLQKHVSRLNAVVRGRLLLHFTFTLIIIYIITIGSIRTI